MPFDPGNLDGDPTRSLRVRYIVALSAVALLTIATFVGVETLVSKSESWNTVINVAGRQRMLSQRIAKAAERQDVRTVAASLEEFEHAHLGLRYGDPAMGLPGDHSPSIARSFELLEDSYSGLVAAARAVVESNPAQPLDPAVLDELRLYEATFLPEMHALVGRMEDEARADDAFLVRVHIVVLIATLLVLALEVLVVFEPAARRLRRQWSRVRESEERFELAVRGSRDAIWDWDLVRGTMTYSPRWAAMFGDERLLGARTPDAWFQLVASSDLDRLHHALDRLTAGDVDQIDLEIEMQSASGATLIMLCRGAAVSDAAGRVVRAAGSLADVTEQHRTRERLREMAECDTLTGLANRASFTDRVELAVVRGRASGDTNFAVLYLDFDGFKSVNDALGHTVGDDLLRSIGCRLYGLMPDRATVARLGGDEFGILIPDCDRAEATRLCDQLIEVCRRPHQIDHHEVISTASVGIVVGPDGYDDAKGVLRDADAAMYAAKASGKSQARFFDDSLHEDAVRRLDLETRILTARPDEDFELVYQPIVDLETAELEGFEALLRWPGGEGVGPDEFIPVTEETGAIVEIGAWALWESAHRLSTWDRALGRSDLSVHVNVSKRQILHPGFFGLLRSVREQYPALDGRIILEVTETAVMDRRANLPERLAEMRAMGFPLAMDDFGTGHSSLGCLHQFPLDVLKIDRSFIMNLETRREFTAVYDAIVSLAQNLGLQIVAEGLETSGQLAQLQAMGCTMAQGYLLGRPMSAEDALRTAISGEYASRLAA